MKKLVLYLFIYSIVLCACNAANEDNGSSNVEVNLTTGSSVTATGSAVTVTGVAATVSGTAVMEKKPRKEKKKIISIVMDETGKQRKLKLESVNTKKKGIYFSSADWATNYSQVQDGHYYYIRGRGDDVTYTIYQDKKKRVGEFSLKEYINKDSDDYPELIGMIKDKKKFYILFDYLDADGEDIKYVSDDGWGGATALAYIDLKEKTAVKLCDMTGTRIDEGEGVVFCNFYQDFLYYNKKSYWDMEYERSGTFMKSPVKDIKSRETITTTANLAKAKPYLNYIDGKIYYGVQNGKNVTLYSYDLESRQEQKVFCYMRSDNKKTAILPEMDEDYIYCQEYLIPRSGGKMIKAFADAKIFKSLYEYSYITKSISHSYNKKYIFYIDKNYKVHRIDKKTGRNHIISNLKAVGVDCTEDRVYVKVHAKAWYDKKGMWKEFDEDEEGDLSYDWYSHHLYCMDINGRNVEKIWNGGWDYELNDNI